MNYSRNSMQAIRIWKAPRLLRPEKANHSNRIFRLPRHLCIRELQACFLYWFPTECNFTKALLWCILLFMGSSNMSQVHGAISTILLISINRKIHGQRRVNVQRQLSAVTSKASVFVYENLQ